MTCKMRRGGLRFYSVVFTTLIHARASQLQLTTATPGELNCDGVNILRCVQSDGVCYSGQSEGHGYLGCCKGTSCAVRTTCVDYSALSLTGSCDEVDGGCQPCNAALPYCFYFTNTQANQYAWYCTDTPSAPFTTAYEVNMVYTSTAGFPTITQPGPSPGQTASSTTSTATSTSPAVGTSHSSLSTGAIAGIAVAGVLLGILFALIAVCLFKWKRKRQPAQMQASAGPFTGAFEYDFYANGRDYGHETQTGAPTMEVSGESRRVVEVEGSTPSTFQDKWTPSQKTISSFSSPYQSPRITSKPSNPNLKGSAENGNLQQIEELDSGGITKSQAQSQQSQQPCPAYWGDLYQSLEGRSLDSSFDRSATGDNVADSDHSTHEVETEEET